MLEIKRGVRDCLSKQTDSQLLDKEVASARPDKQVPARLAKVLEFPKRVAHAPAHANGLGIFVGRKSRCYGCAYRNISSGSNSHRINNIHSDLLGSGSPTKRRM
jgi:hypothetical protein